MGKTAAVMRLEITQRTYLGGLPAPIFDEGQLHFVLMVIFRVSEKRPT